MSMFQRRERKLDKEEEEAPSLVLEQTQRDLRKNIEDKEDEKCVYKYYSRSVG